MSKEDYMTSSKKRRKISKDSGVEKTEATQVRTTSKENKKDISDYERGE